MAGVIELGGLEVIDAELDPPAEELDRPLHVPLDIPGAETGQAHGPEAQDGELRPVLPEFSFLNRHGLSDRFVRLER